MITPESLKLRSSYSFELPAELIAQHPVTPRDASRLLVCRKSGELTDKIFRDVADYLQAGDVLVVNKSKVIPARLFAQDVNTGSKLEILLLRQKSLNDWFCMVKPGKKAKPGKRFLIAEGKLRAEILKIEENGDRLIRFTFDEKKTFLQILDEIGNMPLPPYITEKLEDKNRYQTVYAEVDGSAAAPTAGLHFTEELLNSIRKKGVKSSP